MPAFGINCTPPGLPDGWVAVQGFWGVVGPVCPGWPVGVFLVGKGGKSSKMATGAFFVVVDDGRCVVVEDGVCTTTFCVKGVLWAGTDLWVVGVGTWTVGGVETTTFGVCTVDEVWTLFWVVVDETGTCFGVVTEEGVVTFTVELDTVLDASSASLFLSFFQKARPLKKPFFVVVSGATVVVVVARITGL